MPKPIGPALAAIALLLAAAPAAKAAPQALGLVASNGVPTPLTCRDGECSAEFSAFCLQEARPSPTRDDAYAPAPGGAVTLLLTAPDGSTRRLDGAPYLRFSALIGFTGLKIALPATTLRALGAASVAVEIGPRVTMLPVPVPGDRNPQSAAEIALATGPVRTAAEASFERPGPAADAARITNLLVNALPPADYNHAAPMALWDQMASEAAAAGATAEGVQLAHDAFSACRFAVNTGSDASMRRCLALRHADFMSGANHRFWESQAGS
jgi:hypothetical protein